MIRFGSKFRSFPSQKGFNDFTGLKKFSTYGGYQKRSWKPIVTLVGGLSVITGIQSYRVYKEHYGGNDDRSPSLGVLLYQSLPWRTMSAIAGHINRDYLVPEFLRVPLYSLFAYTYGCNLDECEKDLKSYKNLDDFFTRKLKPGSRKIENSELVSPVDGKVLVFGEVDEYGDLEQIKGVKYKLENFINEKVKPKDGNRLFHVVLYLGPQDYHRFHATTDFKVTGIERVTGEKLSVSPSIVRWIPGLFCLNERAIIKGAWKHGSMYYVPVGATNVGSIELEVSKGDTAKKGSEIGQFHFGSTVVLVFEAPRDFCFNLKIGEKLKLGQSLID